MSSDKHPPGRLTPPEAFPDLDAALAARGIALKAGASRRRVDQLEEPLTDTAEPPTEEDARLSPHPVAFTGAVLGLALIGLLVFSVVRVSGDSLRPAVPILNMPSTSTAVPTPVAAMPPPAEPTAPPPPAPEVAPPQLAAASQDVPPPAPPPENTPEDSMRSRLHERFPLLFPAP